MKTIRGNSLRRKVIRKNSGQSMLPILLTAAAIMTTLIIATSGLTGGARSAKTAQVSVENDMFSNAIYQVINSSSACSSMIINGDNNGSHTPIPFPSNGLAPVYQFKYGLTFDQPGAMPFLTYANRINSLVIPSPVGLSTNQGTLRLDPTGFINYGPQPLSGQSSFAGTNCYLMNLHVEPQSPSSVYGNTSRKFDFPIYIGVNTTTNTIQACQGATAGSPCIAANPVANPSPNPSCATPGVPVTIGWADNNAAYVQLSGPGIVGTETLTTTSAPVTPPSPVPGSGYYTYNLIPFSTTGGQGSTVSIYVYAEMVPLQPTLAQITQASLMSWTAGAYTNYMNILPYPGPSWAPSYSSLPVPMPSPFAVFTFTPSNTCGDTGPSVLVTFSPSPSPSPTPTPPPSSSPSPSPPVSPTPSPSAGGGSPSPSPSSSCGPVSCAGSGPPCPGGQWSCYDGTHGGCFVDETVLDPCALGGGSPPTFASCHNWYAGYTSINCNLCSDACTAASPSPVPSPTPSPSPSYPTVYACTCGGGGPGECGSSNITGATCSGGGSTFFCSMCPPDEPICAVSGSTASCSAPAPSPVNGVCGSANGTVVATIPTTNLCGDGSSPYVSGLGPWTWTCAGSNGGSSASCMANYSGPTASPSPGGVCGGQNCGISVPGGPGPDNVNNCSTMCSVSCTIYTQSFSTGNLTYPSGVYSYCGGASLGQPCGCYVPTGDPSEGSVCLGPPCATGSCTYTGTPGSYVCE